MQFQADILDVRVSRTVTEELSAAGAICMGGLAIGIWKRVEDIEALRVIDTSFAPSMEEAWRGRLYAGWKKTVFKLLSAGA